MILTELTSTAVSQSKATENLRKNRCESFNPAHFGSGSFSKIVLLISSSMTSASEREFCPQRYDTEAQFTIYLIMIES